MPPQRYIASRQRRWRLLKGHQNWVKSVAFSPNGKWLASASADLTVRLWSAKTGQLSCVCNGHKNWVCCVAFSPAGGLLASGSEDNTVRLWSAQTGMCQHVFRGHSGAVSAVAFSPTRQMLASGSADGSVRIWNITGECIASLWLHARDVRHVAFSPCGKMLASAARDNGVVRLWDAATGACRRALPCFADAVQVVAFARDGSVLTSATRDSKIRFWHAETGEILQEIDVLDRIWFFTISPNNKTLAISSSGTVCLWNVATSTCIDKFDTVTYCIHVAFAPNNKTLAITLHPEGRNAKISGAVKICSLLNNATLCGGALLLRVGVAPYVLLEIVDFQTACRKTTFAAIAAHMHFEKISFITLLQQTRNRRSGVGVAGENFF